MTNRIRKPTRIHEARIVDAACRTEFASFIHKCFNSLTPGAKFMPNWHIDALAFHLEQVRLGKIKRLIINIAPRSGKSIVCSVAFPAFTLGHDPTQRLIAVSYGSDLAIKHANDFRAILNTTWYRGVFPADADIAHQKYRIGGSHYAAGLSASNIN
jgi:hypothetical protein